MITPLARMAGTALQYTLPTSNLIVLIGAWLPLNFGFSGPTRNAEMATHLLLFFSVVAVAFLIYAGTAYFLWRENTIRSSRTTLRWIWVATLVYGVILIMTPGMLSHDVFAYSSYGRTLVVYHDNPYFTLFSSFPHDPFYHYDDWKQAPSAYGPVWLIVSALVAFFCGNRPIISLLTYQSLGLTFHLLNILLVIAILRTLKRSERIVILGALLYAWNPLILLESSINGHNDILMITFLLLGLWSFARREQQAQPIEKFQLRPYLFPLLALSLAILVKFSAGPLLALFLVLLARKAFLSAHLSQQEHSNRQRWLAALRTLCMASLLSGGIILLLYAPFWIGWSIKDIIGSFSATPAAYLANGSILRALEEWKIAYGQPTSGLSGFLFAFFLNRSTWNGIDAIATGIALLLAMLWIWRAPSIHTLVLAGQAILGIILLVTPWFFPWYVTWLIPLAVIALPARQERIGRALIGSTLVFSASSLCVYLYSKGVAPIGGWVGLTCLTTILPPIFTFLLLLNFPFNKKEASSQREEEGISSLS